MLRQTPPLESIEIFVAAAQGESFRAVARRLALSPSAVTRRIAALEVFLGVALFNRNGQSHRLSAEGRRYLAAVEQPVRAIQDASAQAGMDRRANLRIAASHSLAASWLMPRVPGAQRELGVEIEVIPTRDPEALLSGEAQFAIWGGMREQQGIVSEPLFPALAMPVTSGLDARSAMWSDEEIRRQPLLSVQSPTGLWERWFAMGDGATSEMHGRVFPTVQLMYEAAAAGAGVALALPLLADSYLRSRRLVPVAPEYRPIGEEYRLFRRALRPPLKPIERKFNAWLRASVNQSVSDFEQLVQCKGPSDRAARQHPPS